MADNRDNTVVHLVDVNVTSRVGRDLLLAEIGKKYGFEADFIHKIYAGAAGLSETDEIVRGLRQTANDSGAAGLGCQEIGRCAEKMKAA